MARPIKRVMLVGTYLIGNLGSSYRTAFESLGCQVLSFDIVQAVNRYPRFGAAGRLFNTFVPVEPWIRKANRDMVLMAIDVQPDLLITFGHYPIRVGALAQIRTSTHVALVHIWPDPFVNWDSDLTAGLPLYDLIATFSERTMTSFQKLGASHVAWVPLAGDPSLHSVVTCTEREHHQFGAEVTFIGAWRPEREAVISHLGDFNLKIWGPEWGRRAKGNPVIMKAWQGRAIYGSEFSKVVACSKVNLNIIDSGNPSAANMRFFEIAVAGGLEVSSSCPEMASEFINGEHVFYYQQVDELPGIIERLLADEELREKVAKTARAKVLAGHTYAHRARSILEHIETKR